MKLEALAILNFNDKWYEYCIDISTDATYLILEDKILAEIEPDGRVVIYYSEGKKVYGYLFLYMNVWAFQRNKGDDKFFISGHEDLDVFERVLFKKLLREGVICS